MITLIGAVIVLGVLVVSRHKLAAADEQCGSGLHSWVENPEHIACSECGWIKPTFRRSVVTLYFVGWALVAVGVAAAIA